MSLSDGVTRAENLNENRRLESMEVMEMQTPGVASTEQGALAVLRMVPQMT